MQNEDSKQINDKSVSDKLLADIEKRFDAEAIAQMVEQMTYSKNLSQKLTRTFGGLNRNVTQNNRLINLTQNELRDILIDVELLKRAVTSLGQVGVMKRRKIEKELILQLFPPSHSRAGVGVKVLPPKPLKPANIDCASRLHICKAACCRIFSIYLNSREVENGKYEWNSKEPYSLMKNRFGCIYLKNGGCTCMRYTDSRPCTCINYSCINDRRIWSDFEKRILNPKLKKQLEKLHVNISSHKGITEQSGYHDGSGDSQTGGWQNDVQIPQDNGTEEGIYRQPVVSGSGTETTLNNTAIKDNKVENNLGANPVFVEPPDFSELREIMIPEPEKKFIPPEKEDLSAAKTETEEEGIR